MRGKCVLKCILSFVTLSITLSVAVPVHAVGPDKQTMPWIARAAFHQSYQNSVVEMRLPVRVNGQPDEGLFIRGTGTVVGKRVIGGPQGIGWFCVLTADHNFNVPATHTQTGQMQIAFGNKNDETLAIDGVAQFPGGKRIFGGTEAIVSRKGPSGKDDLALVAIPFGQINIDQPDDPATKFFTDIKSLTMKPGTLQGHVDDRTRFTQFGYGGTGTFATSGGTNGMQEFNPDDSIKRFQNNRVEREFHVNNATYDYDALRFDFDVAPAFNPAQGADNFMVAEGMGFSGDSGGPFFFDMTYVRQGVEAMTRPGGNNWAEGPMDVQTNSIIAVYTNGFRPTQNGIIPYFNGLDANQFNSGGLGIPLTQARIDWINSAIVSVPEPAAAMLFCVMFVVVQAGRRRRGGGAFG